MIRVSEYVGVHIQSPDWTQPRRLNSVMLLDRVNRLLDFMQSEHGVEMLINPTTKSQIAGKTLGGFRPQVITPPQGSPNSAHKNGEAVDIYDPLNTLDKALNDEILTQFDLYREHPDDTVTWCHLSTRAPRSGKRTFKP